MTAVHIDSSSELSGGVGRSSARRDGERGASLSSVSSSFLEETVRSSGREPSSPGVADGRIINGIPIFLLKGGIRIDGPLFEPESDGTMVTEYDWAPYGASLFASAYGTRDLLAWKMAVLREANIAPAQLHPNSWAAMQAFLAMCPAVGATPTIPVFFHYFEVRQPPKGGWVSLTSVRDRTLFRPYSDSFKNFKHHYFKIIIDASGRHEFHDFAGNPLFPFYWTRDESRGQFIVSPGKGGTDRSSPSFHEAIFFNEPDALGIRCGATTGPSRSDWGPVPVGRAPVTDPVPSLGEGHKDKEASSSRSATKKARKGKEKVPSPPLPGGIFSPAFNMSDRTKFHMSSSQRALIEPLSEVELTNAMLEMSTRAASLAWYLKEFADRRGVDVAEKKNFASLQSAMKQLILTHDDYDKRIELLETDLEKAKRESADASDRLARSFENGLLRSNRALTDDLAKAKEKISELEAGIVFEHEEGFKKALRQASVLAGVHEPFALGFDIEKDVFDGVLVDLNTMADDEGPETEGPSGAVVADEAVEVEDEDEEADDGDN
ncbi:hypothetical protein LR48_Vigan03g082700 [Vigna angularis]|uniref:Transposase (putative) gypsy type domain-containing protein n=1 Tax=Phaseolus angularis TaxID=3914 RepID=A0A0L9U3U4_PHAAN|nr:hypothetical protein LR48_Vigan03g082700 [Vigna angularis]